MTLGEIAKYESFGVNSEDTVETVIHTMRENGEGVVIFLEEDRVGGILTERDLVRLLEHVTDYNALAFPYAHKNVITAKGYRTLEYALHIMIDNGIRRIVVVDEVDRFLGVLTQENIIHHIEEDTYRTQLRVSSVVNQREVVSIHPENTIVQALNLMRTHNIGSVLVIEEDELIGILTERDTVRIIDEKTPLELPVREVMSSPVITIGADDTVAKTVQLMELRNIRRVVVIGRRGEMLGVIGARDILRNIRGSYGVFLENKLKQTKTTLDSIGEAIIEVYDCGNEQVIQWCNQKAKEAFGYDRIDKSITEVIPLKEWEALYKTLDAMRRIEHVKLQIQERVYDVSASLSYSSEGELIRIIFFDVTEFEEQVNTEVKARREKEKLLIQQSKMVMMGEMIGNISHQWKQPLNALSLILSDLQNRNEMGDVDADEVDEMCHEALEQIAFMGQTVDDFQQFYNPAKQVEEFSVLSSIDHVLELLKRSFSKHKIKVIIQNKIDQPKKLMICGFRSEFEQVVLNLLNNALDAIKDHIKSGAIMAEDGEITVGLASVGDQFLLSIRDNGGGIAKSIMSHIFERHYTTKQQNEGSGLGLYMSKMIIEGHFSGTLSVRNEGDGAEFLITLGL